MNYSVVHQEVSEVRQRLGMLTQQLLGAQMLCNALVKYLSTPRPTFFQRLLMKLGIEPKPALDQNEFAKFLQAEEVSLQQSIAAAKQQSAIQKVVKPGLLVP